jgi:Glyoxalase/Bleomycin resistance protein/Dioxygenase superfamily
MQQASVALAEGTRLGFGQSVGQVIQMAYVVRDLRAAIDWWIKDTGVGPWFVLDHFWAPDQVYRGAPAQADVAIAMAFCGNLCIELIQPLDDKPSVYKDLIDQRGYGFHHVGVGVADVDAALPAYLARGYGLAFRANVPTGGAVAYLDNGVNDPGMVELIPATSGMDAAFTRFWAAGQGWDGSDPIRPFV